MAKETIETIIELATIVAEQKAEIKRYEDRIGELTEQCNTLYKKIQDGEERPDVSPSYEELENALLTEQEANEMYCKEVERLKADIVEKEVKIHALQDFVKAVEAAHSEEGVLECACATDQCGKCVHSQLCIETQMAKCELDNSIHHYNYSCRKFESAVEFKDEE